MPRRDWRDWFIMATVVSGVSYGIYSLGKVSRAEPDCMRPCN
jgi:peroxin-14